MGPAVLGVYKEGVEFTQLTERKTGFQVSPGSTASMQMLDGDTWEENAMV